MEPIDPRPAWCIAECNNTADEFAKKGTVKHFMLRMGFMPDNEEKAEDLLRNIIKTEEDLQSFYAEVHDLVLYYKENLISKEDFPDGIKYFVDIYKNKVR